MISNASIAFNSTVSAYLLTQPGNETNDLTVVEMERHVSCNDSVPISPKGEESEMDAFLYIVVVISCYAICMTILMVKYIRREREEIQLDYDFEMYIKREQFEIAKFQNQEKVSAVRQMLAMQSKPLFKETTV